MAVSMKQSLEMRQTLRMTPQLQQAIKLLQLSRMELETAVRKELEENPILEEGMELKNSEAEPDAPTLEAPTNDVQDPQKQDEFDWDNYMESQYKPPSGSAGLNEEIMNYENIISATETLQDHLNWQANLYGFNEEELDAAQIVISYIDDDPGN